MKILIIEDERSNSDRLCRMLKDQHEIVGIMTSNSDTKAFFSDASHNDVDLILSDIQLGDGLSFESLRTVPTSIPVIFITAYDHYAVQAFHYNSIDYLLKPVDAQELQTALRKVKEKYHSKTSLHHSITTTDAIAQLLASVNSQTLRYRERFLIPHRSDEYLIIPVNEVNHITIRDGVVRLCTNSGKSHTINMTLEEAENQLDPKCFMRVNRQFIVSAAAVEKLSTHFLGKMRIHLNAYPHTEIIVSKDKVASVKHWLDS